MPQHVLRGLHQSPGSISRRTEPFASARPTRIASVPGINIPQDRALCLSTSYADCILHDRRRPVRVHSLPQHVLRGLHRPGRPFRPSHHSLPQHVLRGLHLIRLKTLCCTPSLPQHVLRGLHHQHRIGHGDTSLLCLSTSYADCIRAQQEAEILMNLCLSTSYADCIQSYLQRV